MEICGNLWKSQWKCRGNTIFCWGSWRIYHHFCWGVVWKNVGGSNFGQERKNEEQAVYSRIRKNRKICLGINLSVKFQNVMSNFCKFNSPQKLPACVISPNVPALRNNISPWKSKVHHVDCFLITIGPLIHFSTVKDKTRRIWTICWNCELQWTITTFQQKGVGQKNKKNNQKVNTSKKIQRFQNWFLFKVATNKTGND